MNNIRKIFLIIYLLIILIYVTNITSIPEQIILFDGENLNLGNIFGVYANKTKSIQTSTSVNSSDIIEKETITLSLFNIINVKDVEVTTIENTTVVPLGNIIGLKLYSSGVLVIGKTEIEGKKPYEKSNLEEGDLIVSVNNKDITTTTELVQCVDKSNGETMKLKYIREGEEFITTIAPIQTKNKEYKLGLWVRDGAAGIGTITYYEPSTNNFAALGHGIVDADTSKLINIDSGDLVTATISKIIKGKEGSPGEIRGTIINSKKIGNIAINTEFGIYGTLNLATELNVNTENEYKVALRDEITEGPAKIILAIEDGIRKEYNIEITRKYSSNNTNNKSMLIKVTDKELLNLTGGIIQGMSGAPIIQNGKFIGAVTHVFVNDPKSRICSIW